MGDSFCALTEEMFNENKTTNDATYNSLGNRIFLEMDIWLWLMEEQVNEISRKTIKIKS
jgi:hypothetical protein